MIRSSAGLTVGGEMISREDFSLRGWVGVEVPSTVLGGLVQAGIYRDLYVGKNMEKVPREQFRKPWWYRTVFTLTAEEAAGVVELAFEGINYRGDIWLNGRQVAGKDEVTGAFRRFRFDVTSFVQEGDNVLAVKVTPPGPGDFSTGFVDWNIDPPDGNMGIFREVLLHFSRGVTVERSFVESNFNPQDPSFASLTVTADVVNHLEHSVAGEVMVAIDSLKVRMPVKLRRGERRTVTFSPHEHLELNIRSPKLWWPNNLGKPSMYRCRVSFVSEGEEWHRETVDFGIRRVEDFFENGHRGFRINGHKLVIKGAGWTDDLLLMDSHEKLEAQIAYVKHLNLNCIRLEGFWGKDRYLYELCDRHGILIMAGWSCHWEHEEYLHKPVDPKYGGIIEPDEIELMSRAWEDQILWLRNHPSIFVWNVGSDKLPHPDAERRYAATLARYDPTRPYLNSTGGVGSEKGVITEVELISEISGSSGMKMLGPYEYTPPVYWYTDREFGGAYGFNTETSPGASVPPLESIRKMIPPEHLWPVDEVWEYHCGKNAFSTLERFLTAVEKRYGPPEGVGDFAFKAQLLNYELMRPMFEAFQVNKTRAMGVVQWMLNSAWPNMFWQLYDWYLMPTGAFYATRNACKPLHVIYDYGKRTVHLVNDHFHEAEGTEVLLRVYDVYSRLLREERVHVSCPPEGVVQVAEVPPPPGATQTYFLDLRLRDKEGTLLDTNFYWLSLVDDVLDYDHKFDDWPFYTPSKQYADFTMIREMGKAHVEAVVKRKKEGRCAGYRVELWNPSEQIAFFTELALVDADQEETLLPVFWEDNYLSLVPGEKRQVEVSLRKEEGARVGRLRIRGWNLQERFVEI